MGKVENTLMTNEGHNDEVARTTPQRLRLSLDSQNCCTMGIPELLIMLKEIMNNSCVSRRVAVGILAQQNITLGTISGRSLQMKWFLR